MLGSKLPMSMLGKIWDLADQDKDGNLDRWELILEKLWSLLPKSDKNIYIYYI